MFDDHFDGFDELFARVPGLEHDGVLLLVTMPWADQEMEAACRQHPGAAARIRGGFRLLRPTHLRMRAEHLYRGHCRELLGRIVDGEDTRPGTAAECCAHRAAACCRRQPHDGNADVCSRLTGPMSAQDESFGPVHGARCGCLLDGTLQQGWRISHP